MIMGNSYSYHGGYSNNNKGDTDGMVTKDIKSTQWTQKRLGLFLTMDQR